MEIKTVVQEMPSNNGIFKTNTINNISRIRLNNDINIFGTFKNVITLYFEDERPPYHLTFFASEEQRLMCHDYLLEYRKKHILELEKYFFKETIDDEKVRLMLKFKNQQLCNFIKYTHDKIFKQDFAVFAASDAFKRFSTAQQAALLDRRRILIVNVEDVALTWAKTLGIPRAFLDEGVTPLQFFRNLIRLNNEPFKVLSSN